DRRRVNAGLFFRQDVMKFYSTSISKLRIPGPQSWPIQSRKFFVDDKSRRVAGHGQWQEFGTNCEYNLAGKGKLDGSDAGDFRVRIRRIKPGAQLVREFFELHSQWVLRKTCLKA